MWWAWYSLMLCMCLPIYFIVICIKRQLRDHVFSVKKKNKLLIKLNDNKRILTICLQIYVTVKLDYKAPFLVRKTALSVKSHFFISAIWLLCKIYFWLKMYNYVTYWSKLQQMQWPFSTLINLYYMNVLLVVHLG